MVYDDIINDVFSTDVFSMYDGKIPKQHLIRLFDYTRHKVQDKLNQDVISALNGELAVRENEDTYTITIRLTTIIHGNKHHVGITMPEDEFLGRPIQDVSEYLANTFVHSFTSVALSAMLIPISELPKIGEDK